MEGEMTNLLMKKRLVLLFYLFSYSLAAYSKTIIISDIDDTLKKANSVGSATAQTYHFLAKVPYFEMRDLFNEIQQNEKAKNNTIKYYYVSAARTFTFDAQEWLHENNFPLGRSNLKTIGEKRSTYNFKYDVIKKIIQDEMNTLDSTNNETINFLMFGDNAQIDAIVYSDLTKELSLDSQIFIRDVRATATFFDSTLPVERIAGVSYYFSEVELFKEPRLNFISTELISKSYKSYKKQELIPDYTLKTLNRRLRDLGSDKQQAKTDADKYWNDYYSRF
jgi:hypothetical protein